MKHILPLWVVCGLFATGCVPRALTPSLTAQSAQVAGLSGGGLTIRIDLTISNPNSFDLTVRSAEARVFADGRDLGQVEQRLNVRLPAQSQAPVSTQITVPWQHVPSLGVGALMGANIPFHIEGSVVARGDGRIHARVPFVMDGNFPSTMLQLPGLPL